MSTTPIRTAEQHLADALALVKSESIREWASTEHNRPLFLQLSQKALNKQGPCSNANMFAAFIVSKAIGLID